MSKDVYVDASGNGKIAVLCSDDAKVFDSKFFASSGNINQMEFEAIETAIKLFGDKITIYSDNKGSVEKAKKNYKDLDIKWIRGRKNPADKFTKRYVAEPSRPKKAKNPKPLPKPKYTSSCKPKKKKEIPSRYPILQVITDMGIEWMSQSKYKRYQRWLRKNGRKINPTDIISFLS